MLSSIRKTSTLLMLLLAGGFAVLVAELVWMGHTRDTQIIAIITATIGLLFTLVGTFASGRARAIVAVALAVLALTGLYGMFNTPRPEPGTPTAGRRFPPAPLAPTRLATRTRLDLVCPTVGPRVDFKAAHQTVVQVVNSRVDSHVAIKHPCYPLSA